MKYIFALCVVLSYIACNSMPGVNSENNQTIGNFEKGKDYSILKRFRFNDQNGFGEPIVAYSILLPDDWKAEGGISWVAKGLCVNEMVSNRSSAQSPDGSFKIDFYPVRSWNWYEDQNLKQYYQGQAYPGNPIKYCDIMPAYNAGEYLQNIFAAEIGNPTIVSIENNTEVANEMEKKARETASLIQAVGVNNVSFRPSAIKAKLSYPDCSEGIAIVAVSQTVNQMPDFINGGNTNSYVCQADQKIVMRFPKGQFEQAAKLISVAISSIRFNPVWLNATAQIMQNIGRGQQVENAKQADIMRKSREEISAIQQQTWENSQQSNDRIAQETGRVLRGVEQWSDPTSGEKVDLSLGYNQAWTKADGSYILSNNVNFDPNVVLQEDWKKLEKK